LQGHPRPASDQYALAVIVYEWLTGERLFQGSFSEIASQHLFAPPPPLRQKAPTTAPPVEQVVMTALAKKPEERFGGVRAFANALEQAARAEPTLLFAPTQVMPPQVMPPAAPGTPLPPASAASTPQPGPAAPPLLFAPTQVQRPLPESQPQWANIPSTEDRQLSGPLSVSAVNSAMRPTFTPPALPDTWQPSGAPPKPTGPLPPQPPPKRPGRMLLLGLLAVVLVGGGLAFWLSRGNPAVLPGSATRTEGQTPAPMFQVGLVTDIGGLNDRGFNQLAYAGYQKAQQQFGFKVSVIQTQNQNDYLANLTTAAQSNDLVIAVGFLMQTALDQVAKQFPNKRFALVDGCATASDVSDCDPLPNVAPLFFKEQEAGCLVGTIAGQMEKDGKAKVAKLLGANTIGAIGGISIPPVDHYIAGYKFCAERVDPTVRVLVAYSNDFVDTAKCKDIATSEIQQRADIIFQVAGGCGIGALDAAAAHNVYGIGVDTDEGYIHPESVITSAVKRLDTAVYTIIQLTEQNQYPTDPFNFPRFDVTNDGVGYGPLSSAVPADVQPVVQQALADMKSGVLVPPEQIP
jgi:basic membrane protein A